VELANIDSGAWLVMPLYMIYIFSVEILHGLHLAAQSNAKSVSTDSAIDEAGELKER
jgi:hypothetical protein